MKKSYLKDSKFYNGPNKSGMIHAKVTYGKYMKDKMMKERYSNMKRHKTCDEIGKTHVEIIDSIVNRKDLAYVRSLKRKDFHVCDYEKIKLRNLKWQGYTKVIKREDGEVLIQRGGHTEASRLGLEQIEPGTYRISELLGVI